MRFYKKSPLVLLSLICSILFFTSCTKDSDLFAESISQDFETGNQSTEPFNGDGTNLLLNGTFENADEWELLNGSTATEGILTVMANGNIGSDFPNWSAQYPNIITESYYATRRYMLSFEARQTSGTGDLQVGQRFIPFYEDAISSTFQEYQFEFNGERLNSKGNDLVFGGRTSGDTFEIRNMVLKDIGASTLGGAEGPNSPAQLVFSSDFEPNTYPYSQLGKVGENPQELNQWEIDHGDARTTAHPDSPLKSGRDGTGTAVWLGSYNTKSATNYDRNEIGIDAAFGYNEHWIGFSIYVQTKLDRDRIMIQNRPLNNPVTPNRINTLALRQGGDGRENELYFSLPTDINFVDFLPIGGAGLNTESVYFPYNQGEWIDIVIHQKCAYGKDYTGPNTSEIARLIGYDPRSNGFIEIWVNGKKIVDHVGTTAYRYGREGQEADGRITPIIGPYWSSVNSPKGDLYFDNYRLWVGPDGSYEDVNPNK